MPSALLIGGYGVVGTQVAHLLSTYDSSIHLIIAGRSLEKAKALAEALPNATAMEFDAAKPTLPANKTIHIDVALVMVNDPSDAVLSFTHRLGIHYIDITRWTDRVQVGISKAVVLRKAETTAAAAPSYAVFSSSWMAAVIGTLITRECASMQSVDSIDMSVLYALADNAGPNSIEYMDRLSVPFTVKQDGVLTEVLPFSDDRLVAFSDQTEHRVYRIDMPEQFILPLVTDAQTVSTRIGFDDAMTNTLLSFLVRKKIWKLISGNAFTSLRRSLLFSPGSGATHQVRADIVGTKKDDTKQTRTTIHVSDSKGQTHLTAVGAAVLVMQMTAMLQGGKQKKGANFSPAVCVGESFMDCALLERVLASENVSVTVVVEDA